MGFNVGRFNHIMFNVRYDIEKAENILKSADERLVLPVTDEVLTSAQEVAKAAQRANVPVNDLQSSRPSYADAIKLALVVLGQHRTKGYTQNTESTQATESRCCPNISVRRQP